jgi:hypothetical protein
MHSCWIFNERMIPRPVLEYTEIHGCRPMIHPSHFHSITADRQSDAFVTIATAKRGTILIVKY